MTLVIYSMNHNMELMQYNYVDLLPDTTWLEIFDQLDGNHLLKLTVTCNKFRHLIGNSKRLIKKIKFSINFPEDSSEELKNIKKGLETCIKHLTRNYLNLQIMRLRDRILNKDMRGTFIPIITRLSETVVNLSINNCYLLRDDSIIILSSFKHLTELKLQNLAFSDDFMPSEIVQQNQSSLQLNCPNLRVLRLIQCDFYCLLLLKSHDKLNTLEISIASYERPDVEKLEDFLLKQSNLKDLKLTHFRFNSTYSTERLSNVPFQLESLCLKDVCWDLTDHCQGFIKSQKKLKSFELKIFRQWIYPKEANYSWFCDVMKHILILNPLEKLTIDTCRSSMYFKDTEFLVDMCNKNVKDLTYVVDSTDTSELFKIFTRTFPNTRRFTFVEFPQGRNDLLDLSQNLHLFKELKELSITARPTSLTNFSPFTAENLTTFYFHATNEDKSLERLKQIFSGISSKINLFGLCIEPLTIEEILEVIVNFSDTLKALSIEDLHLNVTEAELLIQNFPKLRSLTSDVSISQDVLNILTQNHVTFSKGTGSKFN